MPCKFCTYTAYLLNQAGKVTTTRYMTINSYIKTLTKLDKLLKILFCKYIHSNFIQLTIKDKIDWIVCVGKLTFTALSFTIQFHYALYIRNAASGPF
ncbi:hypothetical protein SAMN06269250_3997 [Spirosoma fluviale]|uniref:Uncharacterized protein n=1 Tax=Spirosoma fluviale TaxID=1597977 RepID=A0A286GAB6_9BACT|nr:hypothetical protein SAMN06269250_3997 [Spirosoma fluviale]